jgi:hypothetical protein
MAVEDLQFYSLHAVAPIRVWRRSCDGDNQIPMRCDLGSSDGSVLWIVLSIPLRNLHAALAQQVAKTISRGVITVRIIRSKLTN